MLESRNGSENVVTRTVYGTRYVDEIVRWWRDGRGAMYVFQDANWNVTSTVDYDGKVLDRVRLTPYGIATFDTETVNGDYDGDGDTDSSDGTSLTSCFGTASGACRIFDYDDNGSINVFDYWDFLALSPTDSDVQRQPGRRTSPTRFPRAHQGLQLHNETLTYQNRHRHMLPTARRFAQRDPLPLGYNPLPSQTLGRPVNLYAYLAANPTIFRDPSGQHKCTGNCTITSYDLDAFEVLSVDCTGPLCDIFDGAIALAQLAAAAHFEKTSGKSNCPKLCLPAVCLCDVTASTTAHCPPPHGCVYTKNIPVKHCQCIIDIRVWGTILIEEGTCKARVFHPSKLSFCFSGDVVVRNGTGATPITQIKPGDEVTAPLLVGSGTAAVERLERHHGRFQMYEVSVSNDTILATYGHPFLLADGSWCRTEHLRQGMRLESLAGAVVVKSVRNLGYSENAVVYNVRVKEGGAYAVGHVGLIVADR